MGITIQAYRRNKTYVHTFPDVTLTFKPNEFGHVVCEVPSADVAMRLLATPTGFREYDTHTDEPPSLLLASVPVASAVVTDKPAEDEDEDDGNVASDEDDTPNETAGGTFDPMDGHKYVLVNGESRYDLRPLDDGELRSFAKANGIKLPPNAKGDTLRDKIVAALSEPEQG